MAAQQQNPLDRVPPSAIEYGVSGLILGLTFGYLLGQARSIGLFGSSPTSSASASASAAPTTAAAAAAAAAADDEDDEKQQEDHANTDTDTDSDDSAQDLGELKDFPGNAEECKLILVVRTDLGMTKGKIAAQCGHATLACYKAFLRANPQHPILKRWERLGQAKVALRVESEDQLLMLHATAVSLGLCAQVIHDAGRTQIASGSATVLGIGPAPRSTIDEVTGHLKLL